MKSQYYWLDTVKNSCQSCHALGSKGIREIPEFFKKQSKDSVEAWARRTQAGQAMNNMALGLGRIGPDRAFKISPTGPTGSRRAKHLPPNRRARRASSATS